MFGETDAKHRLMPESDRLFRQRFVFAPNRWHDWKLDSSRNLLPTTVYKTFSQFTWIYKKSARSPILSVSTEGAFSSLGRTPLELTPLWIAPTAIAMPKKCPLDRAIAL